MKFELKNYKQVFLFQAGVFGILFLFVLFAFFMNSDNVLAQSRYGEGASLTSQVIPGFPEVGSVPGFPAQPISSVFQSDFDLSFKIIVWSILLVILIILFAIFIFKKKKKDENENSNKI